MRMRDLAAQAVAESRPLPDRNDQSDDTKLLAEARDGIRAQRILVRGIMQGMRKTLPALLMLSALAFTSSAASAEEAPAWTITLRPGDFVIGPALAQLHTRRSWAVAVDERGGFDIALRKKAVAIPAPGCKMDFLILQVPFYYPENPKQASASERRAIHDAFVALQAGGKGVLTVRVEAPVPFGRTGPRGGELTACNLLFAFPLSVQVSAQ